MTKTIFKVSYKQDDKLKTVSFDTFASAAGHASGLNGITRLLNVEFKGKDFSHSGTMYIYSKNNTRRVANQYMINQVTKQGGI